MVEGGGATKWCQFITESSTPAQITPDSYVNWIISCFILEKMNGIFEREFLLVYSDFKGQSSSARYVKVGRSAILFYYI